MAVEVEYWEYDNGKTFVIPTELKSGLYYINGKDGATEKRTHSYIYYALERMCQIEDNSSKMSCYTKTMSPLFCGWADLQSMQPIVFRNSAYVFLRIHGLETEYDDVVLKPGTKKSYSVWCAMSISSFVEYMKDVDGRVFGNENRRYFCIEKKGTAMSVKMIKEVKGKKK